MLSAATFTHVTKSLVLNFETLKAGPGNNMAKLRSMKFGPSLANGKCVPVLGDKALNGGQDPAKKACSAGLGHLGTSE